MILRNVHGLLNIDENTRQTLHAEKCGVFEQKRNFIKQKVV